MTPFARSTTDGIPESQTLQAKPDVPPAFDAAVQKTAQIWSDLFNAAGLTAAGLTVEIRTATPMTQRQRDALRLVPAEAVTPPADPLADDGPVPSPRAEIVAAMTAALDARTAVEEEVLVLEAEEGGEIESAFVKLTVETALGQINDAHDLLNRAALLMADIEPYDDAPDSE